MACIVLWIENVLIGDEEGRKKEASKVKQTTQHTKGSHFSKEK